MKKELIIGIVALVLIIVGALIYFSRAGQTEQTLNEDVSLESSENATVSSPIAVPDVNPVNQANPFSDIKTNPFE